MTEILKMTYGIYPKTEKLRIRIGRWGRGVMAANDLETLISDETAEFQEKARKAGISLFTDPLFNWYDIFRPLSVLADGVELGPLTRYGETNTFYRLPEIRGELKLSAEPQVYLEVEDNPPLPLYHVDQGADQMAFLPGPETFFHFCGNIKDVSFGSFSSELGRYYAAILSKFKFSKYFVFEAIPLKHSDFSGFYSSLEPGKTVLFTSGLSGEEAISSAGSKFHSVVTTADAEEFSIAAKHSEIPGLALVDARNTKLEDEEQLRSKLQEYADRAEVNKLYLTHTNYFDFLPRKVADKKLELIGRTGE